MIFRCRCRRLVWFREDESEDHDQAEIIRASLDNLRRLATHPVWASRPRSMLLNSLEGLSPKDRQEYLNNVLVSRVSEATLYQLINIFLDITNIDILYCSELSKFHRRVHQEMLQNRRTCQQRVILAV